MKEVGKIQPKEEKKRILLYSCHVPKTPSLEKVWTVRNYGYGGGEVKKLVPGGEKQHCK